MSESKPEVAVVMGSSSDWETMKHTCEILDQFGVPYHKQVISAHRTPELMGEFAHAATVSRSLSRERAAPPTFPA